MEQGYIRLVYLRTQTHFSIGGERITCLGQNTLNTWGELSPLTSLQNINLNFRHARDQFVDLETSQITQGALTAVACLGLL